MPRGRTVPPRTTRAPSRRRAAWPHWHPISPNRPCTPATRRRQLASSRSNAVRLARSRQGRAKRLRKPIHRQCPCEAQRSPRGAPSLPLARRLGPPETYNCGPRMRALPQTHLLVRLLRRSHDAQCCGAIQRSLGTSAPTPLPGDPAPRLDIDLAHTRPRRVPHTKPGDQTHSRPQ